MTNLEKAIKYAKEHGYETAESLGEWRGYDTYEPIANADEVSYIGLPYRILVRGDIVRMQTFDEVMSELSLN